jgi:tol-pal system protein YbgF
VLSVLLGIACNFPEPTRIETGGSRNNSSGQKEAPPATPAELQRQVQELKADHQSTAEDWDQKLRALQDKIDILEHNFQEEQKKSEKINQDVDRRLADIEKRTFQAPPATSPAVVVPAPEAARTVETPGLTSEKIFASPIEQQYQTILDMFLEQKNYDQSIKEFKKFIQAHPKDSLSGNAQYWIGEGYYAKADYPKAITEFQKVIDNYPNNTKKCDTLLKQGMAFTNMKDPSNAKLFYKETVSQCPGTEASKKAGKLL